MKGYLNLLVISWLVGLFLPISQSFIEPMALKSVTDVLEHCKPDSAPQILRLMLVFLCAVCGNVIARVLSTIIRGMLTAGYISDRTLTLMRKVLFTRNGYLLQNEPEKVVRRISRDAETATSYLLSLWVDAPSAVLGLSICIWLMFWGSPVFLEKTLNFAHQQGNTLLATVIVCMVPLQLLFLLCNKKLMSIDQKQADASEKEFLVSTETLRGIVDIRSVYSFCFAIKRLMRAINESKDTRIRLYSLHVILGNFGGLVWGFSQFMVLSVAAWLIFNASGGFAFSDYMGFSALCGAFNMSVVQTVEIVLGWQKSRQAVIRLKRIESLPDVYGQQIGFTPQDFSAKVILQDISYSPSDNVVVLDNINLVVNPGEHVAVVGPSGCGKSTLLKIIMRHLTPSHGKVYFGGENLDRLNFAYYTKHVAYVSQRPFIFQGSVRDNILMGRELNMDDLKLKRLIEVVGLADDLCRKGRDVIDGLDYVIGADGSGVSGGQALKIALARALAGNPDVLLLDEVTSQLDELSQDRVMRMLAEDCRDKTIVFIGHRISAIRKMDRIVVMTSGRISQVGKYDEVSSVPGVFASLIAQEKS